MRKKLTATDLRRNVYRVLDEVLESGVPREVVRNGRRLLILSASPPHGRVAGLPRRRVRTVSFDELVDTSWDEAWQPDP